MGTRGFRLIYSIIILMLFGVLFSNAQILEVNSVTSCDNANGILMDNFDIRYNRNDGTVFVNISGYNLMNTFIGTVHLTIYVDNTPVGNVIDIPLCGTNIPQVCPIPSGHFDVIQTVNAPSQVQGIPTIAFSLPQAITLKLSVTINSNDTQVDSTDVLCVQSGFGNSNNFHNAAITWASGGLAMAVVGVQAINTQLSSLTTGANNALSYPSILVFVMYSQHIAYLGQMSLAYPKFYQQFTENFAWSTGLIHFDFVEKAISSARKSIGGFIDPHPLGSEDFNPLGFPSNVFNHDGPTVISLLPNVLSNYTNISLFGTPGFKQFNSSYIPLLQNTTILGLQAYVQELSIPAGNVFMTVLVIFLLLLALLAIIMLLGYTFMMAFLYKIERVKKLTMEYPHLYIKYTLQLISMAYSFLITYGLYQFTLQDSKLCLVISGITVAILLLLLLVTTLEVLRADSDKRHDENEKYYTRYGFLYKDYHKEAFIYFVPLIIYTLFKACIVGLAQSNDWVQAIGNVVAEGFILVMLVVFRPYKIEKEKKKGDEENNEEKKKDDERDSRKNYVAIFVSFLQTVSAILALLFLGPLKIGLVQKTAVAVILVALNSLIFLTITVISLYPGLKLTVKILGNLLESEQNKEKDGNSKKKEKEEGDAEKGKAPVHDERVKPEEGDIGDHTLGQTEKSEPGTSKANRSKSQLPPPRSSNTEVKQSRHQSAPLLGKEVSKGDAQNSEAPAQKSPEPEAHKDDGKSTPEELKVEEAKD